MYRNYNTNSPALPGGFPYFPGGSKTVEPWFFASLTNEQGMPIDPTKEGMPALAHHGAFNRFITFRGNKVLRLQPTAAIHPAAAIYREYRIVLIKSCLAGSGCAR
eukprot:SAG11_NODE_5794_length_1462_cov_1.330154_2_plen_105_part_00